ncbi:MAG: carbamoyltransferase HypF [Bacteroidales bacterium]|nr:carbamoyltransferase HypF [Bacteroidales bacterium]
MGNSQNSKVKTFIIEIKGLVQGVGFRPFIYRIAKSAKLNGYVENRNTGVLIKLNATENKLLEFIENIKKNAPPVSDIESINFIETSSEIFTDFEIKKSKTVSDEVTQISPDIAVCEDCLNDIKNQINRINYPFVNCTNCGPRFTIIKKIPYDRINTTMNVFKMCDDCFKEYTDIFNRRFHAQPIACSNCGPHYTLHYNNKTFENINEVINNVRNLLKNKKIVAIKGYGGFFLACNALDEEAVSRLRKRKKREGKPFAVMFPSIEILEKYAFINEKEKLALQSYRKPIVILKQKKDLPYSVNVGLNTIGAILPYMPFHYLLFENFNIDAIIFTSGNISDEPIVTDNEVALNKLTSIADAILVYNREIYNRVDDSVVRVINNQERIIRRSRGYVPSPLLLDFNVEGILATGAELSNCFCIGKGNQAIFSQHIGDLKNIETYEFYLSTIEKFKELFNFKPIIIVSDMHPDYLSTRYAEESGIKHLKMQHHHAHIVACMAEHKLNENVIGVAFDGTGYGIDNNIWGSEFMICNLREFKRAFHFEYIPAPGGDKVTYEPWRSAVSYLYKYFNQQFLQFNLSFLKNVNPTHLNMIISMIDKRINCPLTCGAGRLFDAVSALINLCTHAKFHAEAPMRLESIINESITEAYSYNIYDNLVSFKNTFYEIIVDLKNNVPSSIISTKFHNTVINIIISIVKILREKYNINKVVLSGGSFQNKYLLEKVESILSSYEFDVYSHKKVPSNDGGIALGQLVFGAVNKNL